MHFIKTKIKAIIFSIIASTLCLSRAWAQTAEEVALSDFISVLSKYRNVTFNPLIDQATTTLSTHPITGNPVVDIRADIYAYSIYDVHYNLRPDLKITDFTLTTTDVDDEGTEDVLITGIRTFVDDIATQTEVTIHTANAYSDGITGEEEKSITEFLNGEGGANAVQVDSIWEWDKFKNLTYEKKETVHAKNDAVEEKNGTETVWAWKNEGEGSILDVIESVDTSRHFDQGAQKMVEDYALTRSYMMTNTQSDLIVMALATSDDDKNLLGVSAKVILKNALESSTSQKDMLFTVDFKLENNDVKESSIIAPDGHVVKYVSGEGTSESEGIAFKLYHMNRGDFDFDNHVDFNDFALLKMNFGKEEQIADMNFDNKVDLSDFGLLKTTFGKSPRIQIDSTLEMLNQKNVLKAKSKVGDPLVMYTPGMTDDLNTISNL